MCNILLNYKYYWYIIYVYSIFQEVKNIIKEQNMESIQSTQEDPLLEEVVREGGSEDGRWQSLEEA